MSGSPTLSDLHRPLLKPAKTDMEKLKSDPLYAIGYEHGLEGLINKLVDSEAYTAGQEAGAEARAMFAAAGFEPMGGCSFAVRFTTSPLQQPEKE